MLSSVVLLAVCRPWPCRCSGAVIGLVFGGADFAWRPVTVVPRPPATVDTPLDLHALVLCADIAQDWSEACARPADRRLSEHQGGKSSSPFVNQTRTAREFTVLDRITIEIEPILETMTAPAFRLDRRRRMEPDGARGRFAAYPRFAISRLNF